MDRIVERLKKSQVNTRNRIDFFVRFLNFKRSSSRRKFAKEIATVSSPNFDKFNTDGIVKYNSDYLGIRPLIDEVYNCCQDILRATEITNQNKSGKDYLRHLMRREDFQPNSPVIKMAFNKDIVGEVASFLNDFPVIADIALLYSPPAKIEKPSEFTGSQLFHMDADDTSLCKVWLILEDVFLEDGPTVVVSKKASRKLAQKIGYHKSGRIKNDEIILDRLENNDVFTITGKKKDLIFIDTANCFHYGSRVENKSNGRFMLMISYSTSFALEHGLAGLKAPLKNYPIELVDSQLSNKFKRMLVDSGHF